MANEVEASELAVAKEDLANEEVTHDVSSAEGAFAGGGTAAEEGTHDVKEAKLDVKTDPEMMSVENETQDSELAAIKEAGAEKAMELEEPSTVTKGGAGAMKKPDFNTANEEIEESEIDTKPELGSGSLASGEPKPVDELMSGSETGPGDKPKASGVLPPSPEQESDYEEISGPETGDEREGGEPSPSLEAEPDHEEKAGSELGDEQERDDEPSPDPEQEPGDEEIPGPESGDETEQDGELSPGLEPEREPGNGEIAGPEAVRNDKREQSDEPEAEDEQSLGHEQEPGDEPGPEAEPDSEDEEKEVEQDEDNEEKIEKPLDDDQDRRNPQYIPKGGAFYEHDNRTSLEDVENKDPQDNEKKKKSWKESKDSEEWLHDCYNESEQQPKSTAEIIETYGYDIRRDDAPPRARRRRKYGRGPDKYERSWEDEQAYQMKQNNIGRRGKKKLFGKEEFPPLPNQKFESSVSKPVQKSSIRKKEVGSKSVNLKLNGNEKPPSTSQASRSSHSGNHNNLRSFNSNRKSYSNSNKKLNDSDIKPFRNDDSKWQMPFKHGRQDDFPKPIRTQSVRHSDPPFRRSVEANKNSVKESHISHITGGINQMTFLNKQADIRDIRRKGNGPEESKINEPDVENPANRQNPKRYSKIRKGFTGIFPPEEVPELDQSEIHKLQQEQQKSQHLNMTQPLNMQNVMKRYAGTYGNLGSCVSDFVPGNSSYLQARPIISGIPQQALSPQGIHQQALSPQGIHQQALSPQGIHQQALSPQGIHQQALSPQGIHQQALSPQGIPQQALSPQVSGLPTIELQQNPLGQPNFVPQPMYVDPHFTSDVMGPFSGYSPYSGNQAGEVYQPTRGITYYNTECQTSGQKRPPPRRQNAAIPIVPPPE